MALIDQIANLRSMRYGDQSSTIAQIQSARQAMRILDAEITRTEARLRALPTLASVGGVGSKAAAAGGRASAVQRMAARRASTMPKLFMTTDDGARLGIFKTGQSGFQMSPGVLKALYGSGYAAASFYAVAGIGNQVMDMMDRQRELEKQGISASDRRKQAGLDVIGGIGKGTADIFGINSMASMLLRPAFGKEEAQKRVERVWRDTFENGAVKAAREAKARESIVAAAREATKQYENDNAFLNAWTPNDFEVGADSGRSQLRVEIIERNRQYVDALYSLRTGQYMDKAAKAANSN